MPKNWHNGLLTMANAHLVLTLPQTEKLEIFTGQGSLQWDTLKEKPVIQDGYMELPTAPGWGVELATDLAQHFPYIRRPLGESGKTG